MSNPTELLDLAEAVRKLVNAKGRFHTAQNYAEVVEALAQYDARRAQPEGEAPQADAAIMVPKFEGQFDSHQDWVNRASRVLTGRREPAVCVDALGRRCHVGADMRRAKEEDAFPVRYFWECERATQLDGGQEGSGSNG